MPADGIINQLERRKTEIAGARVLAHGKKRVMTIAQHMIERGAAQAAAEKCNEAVMNLITHLYEIDTDGELFRVDLVTGRLLVAAPWGSVGRPYWALRRSEGDTLRRYVQFLAGQRKPLFWFEVGRWCLNLRDYPTQGAALRYWQAFQMDDRAWKKFSAMVRNGA